MIFFFTNPILIAAAVIPAIVLLVYVYKADKMDKEPPALLLSLILYGIVSTALAMFTEKIGMRLLDLTVPADSVLYDAILYFIIVACSEEGFKYLLLHNRTWRSPFYNCQFDGVVYAVFVSLGFALWENINYVVMYGFGTAMIRAVTAVPGHACFGVFMGAFYGLAKKYERYGQPGKSKLCLAMSFITATILHGCYDFIASIQYVHYAWIFAAFILALFTVSVILVKRLSDHDRYLDGQNNRGYSGEQR